MKSEINTNQRHAPKLFAPHTLHAMSRTPQQLASGAISCHAMSAIQAGACSLKSRRHAVPGINAPSAVCAMHSTYHAPDTCILCTPRIMHPIPVYHAPHASCTQYLYTMHPTHHARNAMCNMHPTHHAPVPCTDYKPSAMHVKQHALCRPCATTHAITARICIKPMFPVAGAR